MGPVGDRVKCSRPYGCRQRFLGALTRASRSVQLAALFTAASAVSSPRCGGAQSRGCAKRHNSAAFLPPLFCARPICLPKTTGLSHLERTRPLVHVETPSPGRFCRRPARPATSLTWPVRLGHQIIQLGILLRAPRSASHEALVSVPLIPASSFRTCFTKDQGLELDLHQGSLQGSPGVPFGVPQTDGDPPPHHSHSVLGDAARPPRVWLWVMPF